MPEIQVPEPIFLERLGGDEIYGYGQDGDVTLASNTTLARDMYYNDLTINSGVTLDTNGYRVFVRGTLTFTDSTSRIGRFSSKDGTGTLKGGFGKGVDATDTLGGRSSEQTDEEHSGNTFFDGENDFFNLSVALAGQKFDQSSETFKFLGGGSGASDGAITGTPTEGEPGSDTNWADRNTVGAGGGKGASGNAATAGTGAVGGGVVLVVAKTVSGDGTIRADADDSTASSDGTDGAPAPDAQTPGNNYSYPGNTNPTNYGSNPTNYGSNSGSNPTNYGSNNTNYGSNPTNYGSHTHYHWHPGPPINNFPGGFYHYHYAHTHSYPGNQYSYPGNNYSYPGNNYSYGYSYPGNNYSYGGNNNPTNYGSNPTNYHPGGAGGSKGTASVSYNAGGGAVIFVTGTKPLPSGLTLAAAQGTSGSGTATAGTVVTVYNIAATDTDPST